MSSWIALSKTEHANKYWRPKTGFEFSANQQIVPIILAELAKVLPHYVTGFVKDDGGSFQWVALVGVGGDRNLYVTPGSEWFCSYIPAGLRAYPFAVIKNSDGQGVFCLDETHLSDDEDQRRLFQDDGSLEKTVAEAFEFLSQCEQNRLLTTKACASLAAANLIQPWSISIERGKDQEPLKIDGMHRIDEDALNALDAKTLADLRDDGALVLAYAQLFTIAQVDQLTLRADYLAKTVKKKSSPSDLDKLLGNEDSGSLNFDAFDFDSVNTGNK